MNYKIVLAALGQDVEQDELVFCDRSKFDTFQLEYNLAELWAWNIRGIGEYQSDGPAVFIEY